MELLETLLTWTDQGWPVAVATVVADQGSTPRASGAKMLLRGDGESVGTVGGGLVEARVIEAAARTLAHGRTVLLDFDLGGDLSAGADLICGGRLTVFLERIDPHGPADIFRNLAEHLARDERCVLASPVDGGPRVLLPEQGPPAGAALPQEIMADLRRAGRGLQAPMVFEAEGPWVLEPWAGPAPLYIAGAGHVSQSTAQIAAMSGFRVIVMDDRPEFANSRRFPWASEISTRDMSICLGGRELGPRASVAIITRGHVHDAAVLAQALRTKAGYIGMIGSRRKRQAIYDLMGRQGFTERDLARVHCPIGLDIAAQTPEEIAVSIVAELIQARAARQAP
jgi:xanthine dehydrogenase accessory factor